MSNIVRAEQQPIATIKITSPDGTCFEYEGDVTEASLILSQVQKKSLLSNRLKEYQPLFIAAIFALLSMWLLLWTVRAPRQQQPQPYSRLEVGHVS